MDRVVGVASVQSPTVHDSHGFSIMGVGHEGVWVVLSFWASGRERERDKQTLQRRGRKTFFPCLCALVEEYGVQCHLKQHRFVIFFFMNSA